MYFRIPFRGLLHDLVKQMQYLERDIKFNEVLDIWNNFFTASLESE